MELWSEGDDWVTNLVYWRGWDSYEPETVRFWWVLAREASVVVDVGAYVGYFSLLAAAAQCEAVVYSLEPHPAVFERLKRHAALNGSGRIRPLPVAAGSEAGAADFFHVPGGLPTSSSLSRGFMQVHANLDSSRVSVARLDDLLAEQGATRVDLIKIDTESTEAAVLEGAERMVARWKPDIVCEVLAGQSDGRAIEAQLAPHGYRYWLLTDRGPLPRPAIEGHARWSNYLFSTRPPEAIHELSRQAAGELSA